MARDPYSDHNPTNTWPTYLTFVKHIIIITVDSWCDLLSSWALIAGATIDRLIYTLQRLAHCTHTTEPMASHSHSGGPTVFRQNQSIVMTLSRPLRPTPNWASPGWPRVYQRHPTTVVVKLPHEGNSLKGTGSIKTTGTQGYVCLPGQGTHAHNLPSWEAPARCTTIDPVRTLPIR